MKETTKTILYVLLIAVLIGGLGFATYKLLLEKDDKNEATEVIKAEESKENSTKKEATLPVKTVVVSKGDLPLRLSVTATADVWDKTTINSEVNGKVEKILVKIGDWVQKGQVLIKTDDTEKRLEVDRLKANKLRTLSNYLIKDTTVSYEAPELTAQQKQELLASKNKYAKTLKDFQRGKITEKKYDLIKDEYERLMVLYGAKREEILKATENLTDAIIALKKAELDLKRTTIRSPFQGKIADIKTSIGERLNMGQEMIKVVNLKSAYLKGGALESELSKLKTGNKVRIKFDAYPDQYFWGEIQSISPQIDESKLVPIYIKVDNNDNLIIPGMNASIDIEYKVFKDIIKVPVDAVITRQDRYLVFIVRDKVALWAYVEVGEKNDEEWEIKKFIDPKFKVGDLVVIEGHLTLAHQSRVRIIK